MVEIAQAEEACRDAEQNVHGRNAERDQQAAQEASALRVLEQERVERAFHQHDEHEDGNRLLHVLLDVRRTLANARPVAFLEGLQLDDRRRMALLRVIGIVGLVMAVFVLFRLDRLAQLVGVNVGRRGVVDVVAHPRSRRRHPGRQAPAHFLGALGDQLFALAPLVLSHRFGRGQRILCVTPRVLAGHAAAEAQLALGALAFQSVV